MLVARVVVVTLLVLLAVPASAQAPHGDTSGISPRFNPSGINEAANEAVASGEIPGAVVVVGRGDDVLFQRAYGSRRLIPSQAPMTLDTIFDIASLTKPVGTTLAVLSLVDRGTIQVGAAPWPTLTEY